MSLKNIPLITIKPMGGLTNRMRAIGSAVALADYLSQEKIRILWDNGAGVYSSFSKLFEPSKRFIIEETPPLSVINIKSLMQFHSPIPLNEIPNPITRFFTKLIASEKKYDKVIYHSDFRCLFDTKYDFSLLNNYNSVYISCPFQFFPSNNLFSEFIPIKEISNIIDSYIPKLKNSIGIHIRRTDNITSIKNSPIELFVDIMDLEIRKNSNTTFFLATDSPDTEKFLINIFGNRIIIHKKVKDMNSEKGIQDAVVDLYCLSKTQKIYGSDHSSFSKTAASISNVDYKIIRKANITNI